MIQLFESNKFCAAANEALFLVIPDAKVSYTPEFDDLWRAELPLCRNFSRKKERPTSRAFR
jgi:hypothetical protein